jgi:hypothetical protein
MVKAVLGPTVTKPTPQELIDEKERSTAVGFFNFAEAYFIAANALRKSNVKAGHIESPIRFLYYQAIELYLKAHLRAHDIHPLDLRTRYAHDVGKLSTWGYPLWMKTTKS